MPWKKVTGLIFPTSQVVPFHLLSIWGADQYPCLPTQSCSPFIIFHDAFFMRWNRALGCSTSSQCLQSFSMLATRARCLILSWPIQISVDASPMIGIDYSYNFPSDRFRYRFYIFSSHESFAYNWYFSANIDGEYWLLLDIGNVSVVYFFLELVIEHDNHVRGVPGAHT